MSRRSHCPTDEHRKTAELLAGYGVPQQQIAAKLGISETGNDSAEVERRVIALLDQFAAAKHASGAGS
jgi:hypothetical protein